MSALAMTTNVTFPPARAAVVRTAGVGGHRDGRCFYGMGLAAPAVPSRDNAQELPLLGAVNTRAR